MEHDQSPKPNYDCLLFDLDDTLYPLSSGLAGKVKSNINEYMLQKLGIEEEKVPELCLELYKKYGTTMAGLKAIGYDIDYDDFHSYVHGRLPYEMLKPDPVLRSLLLSLPTRRLVFTNADKDHAGRVLRRLGLEDCFEGVICFETLNPKTKTSANTAGESFNSEALRSRRTSGDQAFRIFENGFVPSDSAELPRTPVICKPSDVAFKQVFKIANINPQQTLFFDDSLRNLQTGKCVGLHTVLVGTSNRVKGVDHSLESIHNIREALPELWEANEKSEEVCYSGKIAIETSVRA